MTLNSNEPLSEQYRLAALEYVRLDAAATILEESKSAVLSQEMKKLGDIPASHAERDVKASERWREYIEEMVTARQLAGEAKVEAEFIRMRYWEYNNAEANRRKEMGL